MNRARRFANWIVKLCDLSAECLLYHYEYRNYFKLFMLWLKKLEDDYVEYLPISINKMTYLEIVIFCEYT